MPIMPSAALDSVHADEMMVDARATDIFESAHEWPRTLTPSKAESVFDFESAIGCTPTTLEAMM